jgi:hypothetical protein
MPNSYQNESIAHGHSEFSGQSSDGEHMVEIVLENEVLTVICRRSRRRLRDIQASTKASLKLDRARGVLQVKGTLESINEVRNQLQRLTGPFVDVTAAVWAELMRTRTVLTTADSAVAQIQNESGCRIHIERNAQQIRLFGRQDSIAIAQLLLEKLDRMCTQESIGMSCGSDMDLEKLQSFAEEFGVTLHADVSAVTILGIKTAVAEATKALLSSDQRGGQLATGQPSEIARKALGAAMASLKVDGKASSTCSTADSLPQVAENSRSMDVALPKMQPTSEHLMQGVAISKIPPKTPPANAPEDSHKQHAPRNSNASPQQMSGACPTCGVTAKFCVNCGEPAKKMFGAGVGCVTCGMTKFCVYCGHPFEFQNHHTAGTSPQDHHEAFGHDCNPDVYKPDVMQALDAMRAWANQVPMMPMQPIQQMQLMQQMQQMQQIQPMQFVQPSPGNYNLASPTAVPEGMMMMCMNNGLLAASTGMPPPPYTMLPNTGTLSQ